MLSDIYITVHNVPSQVLLLAAEFLISVLFYMDGIFGTLAQIVNL